jgi:predicted nuclease of predicted toxin-antitoxin system
LARLYLDHNVSLHVVPALLASGHDVVTTRDLGAARRSDDAQLLFATQDSRTLVTLDRRDFTMLHETWLSWAPSFGVSLPPHPGILVLDPRPPEELSRILASFLAAVASEPLANELFWWHHLDGWRLRRAAAQWEPYS